MIFLFAGAPRRCSGGRRPEHHPDSSAEVLPGLVLRNGVPEFLMGCIGLNNHPQGQVQVLVNALDLGMNPQQAVDAARFRVVMTTDGACQMVRIHRGESGVGPCLE